MKQLNKLLLATESVGVVFVGIFLAAYLAGLPTTAVLHSELAFRIPLMIFGALLLILILLCCVLAVIKKENSD